MRKNNLWNRIFHKSEVKNSQLMAEDYIWYVERIENAGTLNRLIELHKEVYSAGFTLNLGPCEYGMFRCKTIETMNAHQVWLGGIYGLNTYAAAFWDSQITEPYGVNEFGIPEDMPIYEIIVNQYKTHLLNNMIVIKNMLKSKGYSCK